MDNENFAGFEENKVTFKTFNDNGEEIEFDVIFTFEEEEMKKTFIVYTDNMLDEDGKTKIYAAIYENPEEDYENIRISPITSEDEWIIIENVLTELQEKVRNGEIE